MGEKAGYQGLRLYQALGQEAVRFSQGRAYVL